jgi:hypothetical protein
VITCRDCGEPIQFLDGDKRPYDLTPRIHYANKIHIAAVRKNGAPARRQPTKSSDGPATDPMIEEVVAGLVAQGIKEIDAARYVAAAGEAADVEALLRAALAQKNAEMVAKEKR